MLLTRPIVHASLARFVFASLGIAAVAAAGARADEGMWPYNMAPVAAVEAAHGVKLTPAFLDRAMLSSVRFNNGGSGSFVSSQGLVLTNHHVGADCIAKLSTVPGAPDAHHDGFLAKLAEDEQRCPDLELNQLRSIEDVTAKVEGVASALPATASDGERYTAKKAEMSRLEQACAQETKLRCDVVTLYAGGAYHLYRYKKYTDVRLVFSPEFAIAFYGGDAANFTYPRYDLDMALFRVYDGDEPAQTKATYLPFSTQGPKLGDVVFVSGHPGSTDRFTTVSKLQFLRDTQYPFSLERMTKLREVLTEYVKRGPVEEKAGRAALFGVENSLKATLGYQSGLTDKALMDAAQRREDELKAKVTALPDAALRTRLLEAWPQLDATYKAYGVQFKSLSVLERGMGPQGRLVAIGRDLLRLSEELPKKSEDRLREYRDSNLASLELGLFSGAPIENSYEAERIAFGLENMVAVLGAKDPSVKAALAGKTPRKRAEEVVAGTKLKDSALRRALYKGGAKDVDAAKDPIIELVRAYDKAARAARKKFEDEVEGTERVYAGRIAEAAAKVYGTSIYPDATFTLRINAGVVKGYEENGKKIAATTTFGDLYRTAKRLDGEPAWALPQRFIDHKAQMDFSVPFNFVTTNDIIGGNSGSPVINAAGQLVGLVFDGNMQQLPNRFVYRTQQARAVHVTSNGMLHALDRVYGAKHIVDELLGS